MAATSPSTTPRAGLHVVSVFFTDDGGMLVYTVDFQNLTARFYLIGPDRRIMRTFPALRYASLGLVIASTHKDRCLGPGPSVALWP